MTALDTLLADLIDYAGLFPPASLDLRAAVEQYRNYASGKNASMLGRFVIAANQVEELRSILDDSVSQFRLSVVARSMQDLERLEKYAAEGCRIEAVEIKAEPVELMMSARDLSVSNVEMYVEIPICQLTEERMAVLAETKSRVKVRTGGLVAEAVPSILQLAFMLQSLEKWHIPWKATAGLHHPVRSIRPLTYEPDAETTMMHGFLNLFCAAAQLLGGGDANDACMVLEERDPRAFRVTDTEIGWRSRTWNLEQIREVRHMHFLRFGSCSFVEPVQDLESMGWL